MVQSNKYYKYHAVSVTSEVGLTTEKELSILSELLFLWCTGSHVVRATIQHKETLLTGIKREFKNKTGL